MLIGKTNLPELAIWPFTETETWGVTRNPWDTDRSAGRLQRRLRRRRGGRTRRRGLGLRRRRLDPDPRGQLRPLRPEAAARAGSA